MADEARSQETVPVVTPSGKVGYLPKIFAKEAAGVRKATDTELRAAQAIENQKATEKALADKFENGGLLKAIEGTLAPAAAGAARGLTLGGSDEVATSLGRLFAGDEGRAAVARRLSEYRDYAPISSAAGEIGAIAGAALLGDEAGVGALPNAVGRLGEAVGGGAARMFGGGALARAGGILARGAVEGGIYGAGGAVTEAALGNTDLSGEALVAGGVHGAMFGAALSGGLGAIGKIGSETVGAIKGLRAPKAGDLESLAERTFGEAAPGVGQKLTAEGGPYRAGASLADVKPPAALGEPSKSDTLKEIWRNREITLGKGEDALESHARDFSKAIDAQQQAQRVTDMATFGDAKVNHMSKLVDKEQAAAQKALLGEFAASARQTAEDLGGDLTSGLSPKVKRELLAHVTKLEKAVDAGESAKMFEVADNVKRFVDRHAGHGSPAFGRTMAQKEFLGMADKMRAGLESEAWGAAGEAQKAINAATHENISNGARFRGKFTTQYGDTAGVPNYVANTEAVSSFMGRLTAAKNDLDARAVRDAIGARRAFLDATESQYSHGAAATAAIAQERAALAKMEATFEKATKETSLVNQTKRLQAEEHASGIGGLLGAVTDIATRPVTTLHRLAQIEGAVKSVLGKTEKGVRSLVGASETVAPAEIAAPQGKGFFSSLLDSAKPAARNVAMSQGAKATFDKRVSQIQALQANPAMLTDRIGQAVAPMSDHAPKTTQAATRTGISGVQYLASLIPSSRKDPFTLQPQFQPFSRASDAERAKFMRAFEAIEDPTIVLRAAKSGTLTRDHVEAVKAVYPELYAKIRQQVAESLVSSKSELPYSRRIQLGILLGIPTDRTLAPDFMQAIQGSFPSAGEPGAESPPPTLSRPIQVASALETATQTATSEGLEK